MRTPAGRAALEVHPTPLALALSAPNGVGTAAAVVLASQRLRSKDRLRQHIQPILADAQGRRFLLRHVVDAHLSTEDGWRWDDACWDTMWGLWDDAPGREGALALLDLVPPARLGQLMRRAPATEQERLRATLLAMHRRRGTSPVLHHDVLLRVLALASM